MTQNGTVTPRQLLAAGFVSALSPLIRRFPGALAARAGHCAYLAVPLAAVPMLAAIAAAYLLFRSCPAGTGLAARFSDLLGPLPGRLLTLLYGLWFVFYAGFLLRSGALRFLSTVYPGAAPAPFVLCMALVCALAACGSLPPLARSAMLFRPFLAAAVLLVALLTAKDLDLSLLLPLASADAPSLCAAALELANALSVVFFLGFFGQRLSARIPPRQALPWLAALLGVIALMTVGCLGMFGPALTAGMSFPYFMLVRDLSVLGALERMEPVVIALWVFPDFVLVSLLLLLASETFRFALGRADAPSFRLLPAVCAACAAAVAFLIPGEMTVFRRLSESFVPLLSALFGFAPLGVLLPIGALRKKL